MSGLFITGRGINCRDAMLELELSRIDFAAALNMQVKDIVELCLADANLPESKRDVVIALLKQQRVILVRPLTRERIKLLMQAVHEESGMLLAEAEKRFRVTRFQIELVGSETGWIQLGMVPGFKGFYGAKAVVSLTMAGCIEIGVIDRPDQFDRPLQSVGYALPEKAAYAYECIQHHKASLRKKLETTTTLETMLLNGGSDPSIIMSMLDRLIAGPDYNNDDEPEVTRLTHEKRN